MLCESARADETVICTASIAGLPDSYAGTRAGIPANQATHYEFCTQNRVSVACSVVAAARSSIGSGRGDRR